MSVQIKQKIVGYSVASNKPDAVNQTSTASKSSAGAPAPAPKHEASVVPMAPIEQMHEHLQRPDVLNGKTYKIKSPLFEHALYITITDVVLNRGTPHEQLRPFEVFINSKNMEQFQWVVALTRVMSAVFRKGGDITFLVEELRAVFDPKGGYFKAGGSYMPSLVAEIGAVLEQHLRSIGMLQEPELDAAQKELIAAKRAAYEAKQQRSAEPPVTVREDSKPQPAAGHAQVAGDDAEAEPTFPAGARECHKCHKMSLLKMDGCDTCLNCGYSKCG